jgi:hypothetical protein
MIFVEIYCHCEALDTFLASSESSDPTPVPISQLLPRLRLPRAVYELSPIAARHEPHRIITPLKAGACRVNRPFSHV